MTGNKIIAMEQEDKTYLNGLNHVNGLHNGLNGHIQNGYNHGTNGFINHKNGFTNGLNGYSNLKNGHSHNGGNGYINGINGYSKGVNGFSKSMNGSSHGANGCTNNNNNYLTGDVIYPIFLRQVLKRTSRLTNRRLKIVIVLAMMSTHALMTSVLSYKPGFKTVAPMSITICTDLISMGLAIVCMLWYDCNMKTDKLRSHLYTFLCQRPKDTLMSAAVLLVRPALDQLQHAALRDVGSRGFKVVNHVGVIATLIGCFYTFGRKPRPLQVWSIIIFVGCTQLMEYSNCPANEEFINPHKLTKFIWVTVAWACIVAKMALNSSYLIYLEYFIRCDNKVSIWVRLVQIGFWVTVTDFVRMLQNDGGYIQENGFFAGFNALVWLYVLLRSSSVLLGFLCILYFDSVGKTLQQIGGILLGMQISSVLFADNLCLFSLLSCAAAIAATVAYLQWNGHGKDLSQTKSSVLSPNNTWEIWYLDTMNGDVITLWALRALTYVCVWGFILYSVAEKIQSLLIQTLTPVLVLIMFNILLCYRLKDKSSRFVFRSSVCVCVLSLATYLTIVIIRLNIHIYLIII